MGCLQKVSKKFTHLLDYIGDLHKFQMIPRSVSIISDIWEIFSGFRQKFHRLAKCLQASVNYNLLFYNDLFNIERESSGCRWLAQHLLI